MFFGIDLKELLYFPFKDAAARKHLLIGALVSISAFIIPIVPFFLLTGYAVQIAKQVLNNETPRMIAWEDWSGYFRDGLRVFGVRLVYILPIFVLIAPLFISSFILPIRMANSSSPESDPMFFVFIGVLTLTLCLIIPFSIAVGILGPVAELHVVDKGEFQAGFRFREWWAIFRANLSGFIAAFAIYYLASMAVAILIQILGLTIILACLLPILLPASTIYLLLIMYVSVAQAYRDGKVKLAQKETPAPVL
ncbi:MAG: DUF4013 domain-containing protein [Chloroflexi bacterium]|nr:DUF4013 domain-containing protein [Chloroflexota bacterium]